jgi:hypothetical protein
MKMANVVKQITFLMMVVALAVSLAACTGATAVKGDTGDTGDTGAEGPKGPPGSSDNASPVFTAPTDMIYLAMTGTGMATKSSTTDLSKNFKDEERINLEYRVKSTSDDTVATAKVVNDKMLEVTAKGVGSAMITVEALDGVNAPVEGSFGVMVLESNAAPTTSGLGTGATSEAAKLEPLLYISAGASKVTINSDARPGAASGIDDALKFDAKMGASGSDDDIVSVSVAAGSKVGTWDVTLTPLMSGKQQVRVAITDKFGSAVSADTPDTRWAFIATVNTPPSLEKELEDRTLLTTSSGAAIAVSIAEHFDTAEKAPSAGPDPTSADDPTLEEPPAATEGMTPAAATCSFSTSPNQANGGSGPITADTFNIPVDTAGTFHLTVLCQDEESAVHTTAKITVRPARTS